MRLPQEDCCQALSIAPSRTYQSEGGPGIVDVLTLLRGSDEPAAWSTMTMKVECVGNAALRVIRDCDISRLQVGLEVDGPEQPAL